MKIADYFKGIGKLVVIGILLLLAGVFFFIFGMLYAAIIPLIAIAAVIVLPYYMGRQDSSSTKSGYSLKKVK